jgi:alpha-glucosidase
MYEDDKEVTRAMLDAPKLRYQLIPMLYSLYVTQYHRLGWPVLRPLLWKHSSVRSSLTQDEQFLLGDAILVAPVLEFGEREVSFWLPHLLDSPTSGGTPSVCWWYDLHAKRWIQPADNQVERYLTISAPLNVCPVFIRENGILVLAGESKTSVFEAAARSERTVKLFPSPSERGVEAEPTTFTIVEDDGVSNEASANGAYTELQLTCSSGQTEIHFKIESIHTRYKGRWKWKVELPGGDERRIVFNAPETIVSDVQHAGHEIFLTISV